MQPLFILFNQPPPISQNEGCPNARGLQGHPLTFWLVHQELANIHTVYGQLKVNRSFAPLSSRVLSSSVGTTDKCQPTIPTLCGHYTRHALAKITSLFYKTLHIGSSGLRGITISTISFQIQILGGSDLTCMWVLLFCRVLQ